MAEPKDLQIYNFQKGIADSEHLGFADMRGLDILTVPGIAKINFQTTNAYSTTDYFPQWIVIDPKSGTLYSIDESATVRYSTNNGVSWTTLAGNVTAPGGTSYGVGLVIWKDYLFAIKSNGVDVYGALSGTPAWTNGWKTFQSSSNPKQAVAGQDDILYWGSDRYIISVAEKSGATFDPTSSSTYNYNNTALTLPANYFVICLEELGRNLMIGTGKGRLWNPTEKRADIFPWDRSSTSFTLPIRVNDFGVKQMETIGNNLYFTTGKKGAIHITNGVFEKQVRLLSKPMYHSSTQQDTYGAVDMELFAGAIMQHKGRLFIGVSKGSSAYIGAEGIWSLDVDSYVLNFEQMISTGNAVSANGIRIGALYSVDDESYLIGWSDLNTGTTGTDYVDTAKRYTSYTAYLDSPIYEVGTPLVKKKFSQLDISLAKQLQSGQGVKVYYRSSTSDSFTLFATFDYSTHGATRSFNFPATFDAVDTIQFRIALTTASNSRTSPQLKKITLR